MHIVMVPGEAAKVVAAARGLKRLQHELIGGAVGDDHFVAIREEHLTLEQNAERRK